MEAGYSVGRADCCFRQQQPDPVATALHDAAICEGQAGQLLICDSDRCLGQWLCRIKKSDDYENSPLWPETSTTGTNHYLTRLML